MFINRLRSLRVAVKVVGLVFCMLVLLPTMSLAAPSQQDRGKVRYDFAIKLVCGNANRDEQFGVVQEGNYSTVINIHDWAGSGGELEKWAVESLPEEQDQHPRTEPIRYGLKEYNAFEIDCLEIWAWLGVDKDSFHEGFVHLTTVDWYPAVVAVYTVETEPRDISMHVQEYEPKETAVVVGGFPDLLPIPPSASTNDFCVRDERGLTVTIKNQGAVASPASITHVDFSSGTGIDLPTPALAAGAATNLIAPIPAACFRPDCKFEITADYPASINESDESNNKAYGTCIG